MKSYKSFRLFNEKISFLMDKKAMIVIFILFLVTSLVFVISTGVGEMNINPLKIGRASCRERVL